MYPYTLKRSNRKTMELSVTRELIVLVRAPMRMPLRDIERFLAQHAAWVDRHLEQQRQRALAAPPEALSEAEIRALRQEALDYLPGRVAHFGRLMGLEPTGVRITGARRRFGSCSARNSLCFSYRLMRYPPEAIDLVVVHELAHIPHKNHGSDFYACIAAILPDYKVRQKLLREGSPDEQRNDSR